LGELLSELIVAGKPSMDISMMDPARAAISLPEEALKQLCRLQYAHHYWAPETMPATVN
jgi:hypothetical protein